MKVPFLDLNAHHQPIRAQLDAAIREVIDTSAFAGGPFVAAFEREFAKYCGSNFAVGVGNGTDAIWLTLLALGVGEGDEVITVPSTFMATAEAISYCGARPKFVDIDEQLYTMDPTLLERAISPRTKAIVPVHLFGQCADMDPILEIANRHGIPVVEDACQAHGAVYKKRKAGVLGVAGCFSFYPGKNLGALGEAGGVTTNEKELAAKIQVLRDHGQHRKYYHSKIGWNARMDGIQGAVLTVKLKHLEVHNVRRHAHGLLYDQLLGETEEIITPFEGPHNRHVYHIYAVRVKERNQILQSLADRGISCAIHYPIPVHLQEAYRFLGHTEGSFPVTERCAEEFLSLPMFPELTTEQIHSVAEGTQVVHRRQKAAKQLGELMLRTAQEPDQTEDEGIEAPPVIIDPLQRPDWDAMVAALPQATVFHGAGWARVLKETYGHLPMYVCRFDGARLAELLPVMEVASRWTGRRGVSLPFTDGCARLGGEDGDGHALYREAMECGRRRRWKYLECRSNERVWEGSLPSLEFHGHVIDLRIGVDRLFAGLDGAARRAVRKAEARGLKLEFRGDEESVRTFYKLHCGTRRRHGLPPQPFRFFENIQQYILGLGRGFVAIARMGNQAAAAGVFFYHGGEAIYKFGASDFGFQQYRPNNLMMWAAMRRCAEDGLSTLNLGRTSLSNEGLRRFKLGLGAAEIKISYAKYDFVSKQFVMDVDQAKGWFNIVFSHLPLPLLRLAGAGLYPHLS